LFEQVKNEIPNHIGVYVKGNLVKRAKKQELGVEEQVLKDSMIRSLSREFDKSVQSDDTTYLNKLKRDVSRLERERSNYHNKYNELYSSVYLKLGREWVRENI